MSQAPVSHNATAFGLTWQSDIALPLFASMTASAPADIVVRRVPRLRERTLLRQINRGFLCSDGVRFLDDDCSFDMVAGSLIEWMPGPDWSGTMPQSFSSTVAATLLAWRGGVPLHGSAVEIAGRAVLLCGPGGAGKSTLAASLTLQGARLISDDLSVLTGAGDPEPCLVAGRSGVRLDPTTAEIGGFQQAGIAPNRGKIVVLPQRIAHDAKVPLSLVVALSGPNPVSEALEDQLFRPYWMASLPGAVERVTRLRETEKLIDMRRYTPSPFRKPDDVLRAGADLMAFIEPLAS